MAANPTQSVRTPRLHASSPRLGEGMGIAKAQTWIVVSAITTAGMYLLRRLVEGTGIGATGSKGAVSAILGSGSPPPTETWIVAYGFTYTTLAVVALGAPELAAAFAILILTVNAINNGITVTSDIGKLEGYGTAAARPSSSTIVIGAAPVTPPGVRAANIIAAQEAAHNNQYRWDG